MNEILFYVSDDIEIVLINSGKLRFEEHCHSSHTVISALLCGNAELSVNGVERNIDRGTVFFLLPYENHSIISEEAVDMVSLCVKREMFSLKREDHFSRICSAISGVWEGVYQPTPQFFTIIILCFHIYCIHQTKGDMYMKTLFDKFNEGIFTSPYGNKAFADLKWNAHPVFEGVEL